MMSVQEFAVNDLQKWLELTYTHVWRTLNGRMEKNHIYSGVLLTLKAIFFKRNIPFVRIINYPSRLDQQDNPGNWYGYGQFSHCKVC